MKYSAVALLFLAGCGTMPADTVLVNTPIPLKCQQVEPERPVMPTETLSKSDSQDAKVAAALAEIDIREGYELRLVTALRACK